jgi:hypothetical protein
MSKFIFLFLIPVIGGIYTSSIGLDVLNPETALHALGLLLLIGISTTSVYLLFFNN